MNWEGSLSGWENYDGINLSEWHSIRVYTDTPVARRLLLGFAHREPNESAADTEWRVAHIYGVRRGDMTLEIVGV